MEAKNNSVFKSATEAEADVRSDLHCSGSFTQLHNITHNTTHNYTIIHTTTTTGTFWICTMFFDKHAGTIRLLPWRPSPRRTPRGGVSSSSWRQPGVSPARLHTHGASAYQKTGPVKPAECAQRDALIFLALRETERAHTSQLGNCESAAYI